MKKIKLEENVYFTMINTSQFKDVTLSIRFLSEITRKSVLIRHLLSYMLCDRCEKWDSKQALSNHLDDLYGASVACRCSGYGQNAVFEYRFKCLNDLYTQENTFERLFKTAHEFVYHPLMQADGLLNEELFEEAKRELLMANERKLENPHARAVSCATSIFAKGYPLQEIQLYTKEEIQALSLTEATQTYQDMIKNDAVILSIIGKIDENKTLSYVKRFFPFEKRADLSKSVCLIEKKDFTEEALTMKIDQSNLVMIFSTPITILSEDYWKLRVANAMFGQLPTSLLFNEVREKRSLCYSISSSTMGYEGAIYVTAGIQKEAIEETKACILKQLERLKQGDFDDSDLETAKKMLANAIYGSYDDSSSTLNFAFKNCLLNQDETIEDCIAAILATKREDIQHIFNALSYRVCFILKQEDNDE